MIGCDAMLTVAGAILMSVYLYPIWGWIGVVVGIPVGLVAGAAISIGAMFAGDKLREISKRKAYRRDLHDTFGTYRDVEHLDAWTQLLPTISRGSEVSGKVIQKYRWIVILDIGVGFPAELSHIKAEWYDLEAGPDIGSELSGWVTFRDSREHVIELTMDKETLKNALNLPDKT